MNINDLEKCFQEATIRGAKYVGVKIEMQGFPKAEIIINENENFDSKLAYYKKSYNDDLTLKAFNGIRIIDFAYEDSFEAIEKDLMES
jgi:23S rRNA A1618 N6-methylase RlmF